MISKSIRNYYNGYIDGDKDIEKDLKSRINHISKPCWELKICPYGYLVEDFPLPGIRKKDAISHIEYLKECVKRNKCGPDYSIDLDDDRKKLFMKEIKSFNADDYDDGPFKLEEEMSCKEFGHICPAYFASEPFTETKEGRKRSRNISFETKVRVMRRDNYTCQICGKQLLDREVEFDHIIPYSKGGHSDESNIRVTCSKCNKNKSNKISEVVR